jgi:hypothetical protein
MSCLGQDTNQTMCGSDKNRTNWYSTAVETALIPPIPDSSPSSTGTPPVLARIDRRARADAFCRRREELSSS